MEPTKQTYSFDIILMSSNFKKKGEEFFYCYSVRLFEEFEDLPERRLLTDHFPSKPLGEFVASPCDLIGSLASKGVCVTLLEDDVVLGCGNVMLSSGLLRKLAEPNFTVTEEVTLDLTRKKATVAKVQLNIKFSSTDPNLDTRLVPFGCYDVCKPMDKSVNPRDVIFTLGRSNTGAVSTCITDERLMSHAGAPFNCIHAKSGDKEECGCFMKGVKPPPDLDQTQERERKLLKKLLVDLDIDKVHIPTPPSGHEKSKRCKCRISQSSSDSSSVGRRSSNSWTDLEDNVENFPPYRNCGDGDLTSLQRQELEQVRKRALGKCPMDKSPELVNEKYKPPLLCPVCQANITWLPKVAACPYCNYKRFDMDKPSEEPFDETATAAEILRNQFLKNKLDILYEDKRKHSVCATGDILQEGVFESKLPEKDCCCKADRICTRCRIRELCEQMFHMTSQTKMQQQLKAKVPTSKDGSAKELKKKTSTPSQRREQLVKIFTEMRDHYGNKKHPIDPVNEKLRQECEAECRKVSKKSRSPRGRRRASCALKQALQELEQGYPVKKRKARKCKVRRRMRSKRYTFLVRKEPVRPRVTHQACARDFGRVPCHMGWMWTQSELARHRCWKPGAIAKPIREIMAYFLKDYPVDVIGPSRFHCGRRQPYPARITEEPLIQHPTLHITKKHDEYVITLRPLKDPKNLAVAANPYANMKPVVFRISKDPIATGLRNIKESLMEKGYPLCRCGLPIANCFCRSHVDKKIIEDDLRALCQDRGWNDITNTFVYDDPSESESDNELDFGVTPPAGVIKPERLRKPDRCNTETQYNENDWAMPTMFPHPPNAHVQYGGCVVGERLGRFPWIFGKGFVHQKPKKPKQRNMPKKKKKTDKKGGRQKGGFDTGYFGDNYSQYSETPTIKRSWHKSNEGAPFTYSNGLIR